MTPKGMVGRNRTARVPLVSVLLLLASSSCCCFCNAFFQNLIPAMPKMPGIKSPAAAASAPLLAKLEELIAASNDGVTDPATVDSVKDLMIRISETRPLTEDQRRALSGGTWELIYTTEKEINFFKTSWPFAKVSSITQRIGDLYNNNNNNNNQQELPIVENFIDFEGGGQFAVTGTVKVDDNNKNPEAVEDEPEYDRVAFSLTIATAVVWGKSISLPPVGAGWFDTMFCNDQYRLSRDSRGDYSVFRRVS